QSVRNQMASPDLVDEVLGFGELVLGTGQAATLENINSEPRDTGAFIAKQLVKTTDGRTLLIETVAYKSIADELQSLPDCNLKTASIKKIKDSKREGYAAVPPRPSTSTRVALNRASSRIGAYKGVAIDYLATIGGTYTAKVFQGDTTYFVSSAVICNSTTTLEPGAIFKQPTNANTYVKINSTLNCKASSYRP